MGVQLWFLAVGNADCMFVVPESRRAVVVDIGHVKRLDDTLRASNIDEIGAIYITHEHEDHAPNIEALESFIARRLAAGKTITRIRLPRGLGKMWIQKLKNLELQGKEKEAQRLRAALQKLKDHEKLHRIVVLDAGRGEEPYSDGETQIEVLHPSYMFLEALLDGAPKPNEASMVLRIVHGHFAALLLGDLDGRGLQECVELDSSLVRAHVVKIPHHGAWPSAAKYKDTLIELLLRVEAELAILSVGSKNHYGHVKPELFSALLQLNKQHGLRFICTEATRTCMHPAAGWKDTGLSERHPCAGDVTVHAESNGTWTIATETDHALVIKNIPHAVCDYRSAVRAADSILRK